MDIEHIKELLRAFDASKATSLKLEDDCGRLELVKEPAVLSAALPTAPAQPKSAAATEESAPQDFRGTLVKSPIVGIAYQSAEPGAAPFAVVGQRVKKGQTLCIIEAMKMFNDIKAPCDGEILSVLFENGQLVEFDMPLYEIGV